MFTSRIIHRKIKSIENTKKITQAMEIVSASKMQKAQEKVNIVHRYVDRINAIASNIWHTNSNCFNRFVTMRNFIKKIGFIVVTTNKGLCGSLNTNSLRLVVNKMHLLESQGNSIQVVVIGNKGLIFLQRIGVKILAYELSEKLNVKQLMNSAQILLDAYFHNDLDAVYLVHAKFINTIIQKPHLQLLLPFPKERFQLNVATKSGVIDYIYEPNLLTIVDALLMRYLEALIYQAVVENVASEQAARMIAMKAASDNASTVIDEFKLLYNKTRQTAITTELSEIIAGASAI